ncbi:choice-of-anchor Q domain-containing protein [Candidatus Bipolaricaulota bacterium]
MRRILACGTLLALTLFLFAPRAWAADQVVTNLGDDGPGSLRVAISDVGSGENITLQVGLTGTITLTTGELVIDKSMTIAGPGASQLTVSGNNASRVLHVTSGSTVTVSGVTITGGQSGVNDSGGGVRNEHDCTLTLTDCAIAANTADQYGGGIFSIGVLILTGCEVSNNSSSGGAGVTNYAGFLGEATLTDCTVRDNTATYDGGGIANFDQGVTIRRCTISGNEARRGGGIYNHNAPLKLENCTVSGNEASWDGGGIYDEEGGCFGAHVQVLMADGSHRPIADVRTGDAVLGYDFSRLKRVVNVVHGVWRADVSWYLEINGLKVTASHPFALGRDRWVSAGDLMIGDRVLGDGQTQITHSLRVEKPLDVYNLSVSGTHTFYVSDGRGDFLVHNKSTILNCVTITDNTADTDGDGIGDGGGVCLRDSLLLSVNSIVAGNRDGSSGTGHPDCSGRCILDGYNLIGDGTGMTGTSFPSDKIGSTASPVDPLLGPLADNGGPTLTHALLVGSSALDAIPQPFNGAPSTDQRGLTRPWPTGGLCDIGAVEMQLAHARGDVNGDGTVDLLDARLCLQIAQGHLTGTAAQRSAADFDRDGDVDRIDAELLAQYILGI